MTVASVEQDTRPSAEEHARQYALATNGLFQTRMTIAEPKAILHGLFLADGEKPAACFQLCGTLPIVV